MIYKISYKSRDLRRKNVLVYGIEELPLFEVNINISGYACETEERVRQIEKMVVQKIKRKGRYLSKYVD